MPRDSKLEDVLQKKEAELGKELGRRWLSRADPERLQPLGVLRGLLGEVRRIHLVRRGAGGGGDDSADYHFAEFLRRQDFASLSTRAAWECVDDLERMLLETADREYIHARLAREATRDAKDTPGYDSWGDLFEADKLKALLQKYEAGTATDSDQRRAVEFLVSLYNSRGGAGRHRITSLNLKTRYLNRLAGVLALLLALLFQAIYLTGKGRGAFSLRHVGWFFTGRLGFDIEHPSLRQAIIAAVMGALGSVLSALYKLRDQSGRIDDLRTFGSMMLAQPFVGATAGVFLFCVLKSGVLGIQLASGVSEWGLFAVFGLAAGFSEPFLLNVVGRVVGAADKAKGDPSQPTGGTPASKPSGGANQPAPANKPDGATNQPGGENKAGGGAGGGGGEGGGAS